MAKPKVFIKCKACDFESANEGLKVCPQCGNFDLERETRGIEKSNGRSNGLSASAVARKVKDIQISVEDRTMSGISEFDRVMGNGITSDSVTSLSSPPGMGKSTLLVQVANTLAAKGQKVLYVAGEESSSQIKSRTNRVVGEAADNFYILETKSMDVAREKALEIDADVVIVDSINTMSVDAYPGSRAGTPTQMMESGNAIVELCKYSNKKRIGIIIVQMTKEDEMSGPRSLEHLVDTTLYLEGEDGDDLRMLRSTKNRFGDIETGLFLMTERGLEELSNPSEYFVTKREKKDEVPGVALSVIKEGTRPIVVEIEALLTSTSNPYPSRIATCLRKDNLNILLSIISQKMRIDMNQYNVVINTTGGLKLSEPAVNLAIIMSILSLHYSAGNQFKPIPGQFIYLAEVGLTGELKKVQGVERRLKEIDRMGYQKVFVAPDSVRNKNDYKNIEIVECKDIAQVVKETYK